MARRYRLPGPSSGFFRRTLQLVRTLGRRQLTGRPRSRPGSLPSSSRTAQTETPGTSPVPAAEDAPRVGGVPSPGEDAPAPLRPTVLGEVHPGSATRRRAGRRHDLLRRHQPGARSARRGRVAGRGVVADPRHRQGAHGGGTLRPTASSSWTTRCATAGSEMRFGRWRGRRRKACSCSSIHLRRCCRSGCTPTRCRRALGWRPRCWTRISRRSRTRELDESHRLATLVHRTVERWLGDVRRVSGLFAGLAIMGADRRLFDAQQFCGPDVHVVDWIAPSGPDESLRRLRQATGGHDRGATAVCAGRRLLRRHGRARSRPPGGGAGGRGR